MSLLNRWWSSLGQVFVKRFFRLREIESVLASTDDRYLDAHSWATMRGISEREAQDQLLYGVKLGHLERCYLYEWSDAPTRFVVPESYLGKTIRLSDVGFIGEDDWKEVELSPYRVREVFIAATP
jgi:hypothetical protein